MGKKAKAVLSFNHAPWSNKLPQENRLRAPYLFEQIPKTKETSRIEQESPK